MAPSFVSIVSSTAIDFLLFSSSDGSRSALRFSSFYTSLKASSMGSCSLRFFGLAPRLWFFERRLSRSISSLLPAALHDVLEECFFGFFLLFPDVFLECKAIEDFLQHFLDDVLEPVDSIL